MLSNDNHCAGVLKPSSSDYGHEEVTHSLVQSIGRQVGGIFKFVALGLLARRRLSPSMPPSGPIPWARRRLREIWARSRSTAVSSELLLTLRWRFCVKCKWFFLLSCIVSCYLILFCKHKQYLYNLHPKIFRTLRPSYWNCVKLDLLIEPKWSETRWEILKTMQKFWLCWRPTGFSFR